METQCLVDNSPLSAPQLQGEVTPPKKHLMIIPKKGQGSKMALYANFGTGPLLVAVDLLDSLLQRLTHRVRVFLWKHVQVFGEQGGFTIEDLIRKVLNLSSNAKAQRVDKIEVISYQDLLRILVGTYEEKGDGVDDEYETFYFEDSEDDKIKDGQKEEGLEEIAELSQDLNTLKQQYEIANDEINKASALEKVNSPWLQSLLLLAECSLLISSLQSPLDVSIVSLYTLRAQLMDFVKSKAKGDRNQAALPFGSLLSRDFLAEIENVTQVKEDLLPSEDATTVVFLPQRPSNILTMELPLYAPKAFSCKLSQLEDRETILDDIWEHHERYLRALQEDVSKAPELLTLAVVFWRRQVAALKIKRKRKNQKTKSMKKLRKQS